MAFHDQQCDPLRYRGFVPTTNFQVACLTTGITNRYELSVKTILPLPKETTTQEIKILTDHAKYGVFTVPVIARVQPEIMVVPSELMVKMSGPKPEPVTCRIVLRFSKGECLSYPGDPAARKGVK